MYFPVRKHYVTPKKKKKKERKKALRDSRGLQFTFKSLELGSGQPAWVYVTALDCKICKNYKFYQGV